MKASNYLIYVTIILSSLVFSNVPSFAQYEWELSEDPILSPGYSWEWDGRTVYDPTVIYDNGFFHLWYNGHNDWWSIGYATSENGFDWVKCEANPVITDGYYASGNPSAIKTNDLYYVYFNGNPYGGKKKIYLATSEDGIDYDYSFSHPVLDLGNPGEWDDHQVTFPSVCYDGIQYKMYYMGHRAGTPFQIGLATSVDGENWTKFDGNPVLKVGEFYEWDSNCLNNPSVHFDGRIFHMWYGGGNGSSDGLGYAWSHDGLTWEKYAENPVLTSPPQDPQGWCSSRIAMGSTLLKTNNDFYMPCWGSDGHHEHIGIASSPIAEPELLLVVLTPDGRYFQKGGTISFTYEIRNISDIVQTFDAWGDLFMIGAPYQGNPIWEPRELTLLPEESITDHIGREIPLHAPAGGPYSLLLKAGEFSENPWEEDGFRFYILP